MRPGNGASLFLQPRARTRPFDSHRRAQQVTSPVVTLLQHFNSSDLYLYVIHISCWVCGVQRWKGVLYSFQSKGRRENNVEEVSHLARIQQPCIWRCRCTLPYSPAPCRRLSLPDRFPSACYKKSSTARTFLINHKKLSYCWQTAWRICANAKADLLKTRSSPYVLPCRILSFCLKVCRQENPKIGERWNSALSGWEAWLTPAYTPLSHMLLNLVVLLRQRCMHRIL